MAIRYLSGINVDSNTLFVDDANNRVGIGTASPLLNLQINSLSGNNSTLAFSVNNSLTWYLRHNAGDGSFQIVDVVNTTTRLVVLNSGNVGIGTTAPNTKLQISGENSSTASTALFSIQKNEEGYGLFSGILGSGTSWFQSSTKNESAYYALTLQPNGGNVGIGTTSPTKKLQIGLSNAAHADEGILLQSPSGYGEGAIYHDYGQSTGLTAFKLLNTYAGAQIALSQDSYSSTGSPSSLRFYTAPQAGGNTPVERMRISSVGALKLNAYGSGSNTGTATQRLAVDASGNVIEIPIGSGPVDGNGTANYVTKWSDADTITNSVIYENGGNIGIGVTNADYPLTVGSINVGGAGANLGLILNSVISTAIPSSSVKAIIGATNSGFGYAAGSLLIQPRTGVNAVIAFATEGTEKMRITHDGNVGIGTTSPATKFHTVGYTTIDSVDVVAAFSSDNANKRVNIGYSTSGDYGFINAVETGVAWKNLIFGVNGGNIGIGTTSPNEKLHVAGNVHAYAAGGIDAILYASTSAGSTTIAIRSSGITHFNGGNVGIGTTSPSYKLDVSGTGRFTSLLQVNGPSGEARTDLQGINLYNANNDYRISFDSQSGTRGYIRYNVDTIGSTLHGHIFSAGDYNGTVTELMLVRADGNVGIGTTSPASKLEVAGGIASTFGSTNGYVALQAGGSTVQGYVEWFKPGPTRVAYMGYNDGSTANNLAITLENSANFIVNGGSVGIGTTGPSYKLHTVVASAANADIFQAAMAGVSNGFSVQRVSSSFVYSMLDGALGINNASPTQALHVTGNARVTGAYYDSNNEAGTSGQVLSSTGSGTDWVTPATTTATSLYDLLPAARVAYNWTGQVVNDTWTTIFSKSDNILTTGTWMVKMYVNDFAVGGGHYQYVYSGIMTWEQGTVNQTGEAAFSEIYLHRMGHAANASVLYLRTAESGAAASNLGYFQIKGNYSNTSNQTIQFQFVKIF